MSTPFESQRDNDPLRPVRRAVSTGRFQDAWAELQSLPADVRGSPEGRLLAAMASWRLGRFGPSRTDALQARDGFRARGDVDGEMRAENVAAAGAFALGELGEAERGFTRALSLADELRDELMIARCANNLGNVAYYLARTDRALSFYRLAAANFEKLSFWKGLAEAWLNSALVLFDGGQLDASREAGKRAVAAAERSGDQRVLGQALAARSETDLACGDLALGRALAERALVLARGHDHIVGEADALRVLSAVARMSGEPARAEELARQALAIARRVEDPWRRAEAQQELGALYESVGRLADAAASLADAAEAFAGLGSEARAARLRARAAALSS